MVSIADGIRFVQNLRGTRGTFTIGAEGITRMVAQNGPKANEIFSL